MVVNLTDASQLNAGFSLPHITNSPTFPGNFWEGV